MAVSDFILQKPKILLSQTTSPSGAQFFEQYLFGLVENVYETCDAFEIGQVVGFNPSLTIPLRYSGTDYFLVNEGDLLFIDNGTPP